MGVAAPGWQVTLLTPATPAKSGAAEARGRLGLAKLITHVARCAVAADGPRKHQKHPLRLLGLINLYYYRPIQRCAAADLDFSLLPSRLPPPSLLHSYYLSIALSVLSFQDSSNMASQRDPAAYFKRLSTHPPPGSPYGVPVPGSERPGRSAVYRNWAVRDEALLTTFDPEIQSTHDIFEAAAVKRPSARCLGTRHWNSTTQQWEDKFDWLTYGEVDTRRKNFGAGIAEIHQRINYPKDQYGVGLWAQNRVEWQITDLGLASQALYTVSLYETLGPEATEYIINHAELACVACSLPHIPVLLKMAPRLPGLKLIVSLDPLDHGELDSHTKAALLNEMASQHGIQIYSIQEVEELGARSGRPVRAPRSDEICTINYTSGTTGPPKGVVITHGNAVAAVSAGRTNKTVGPKDVHMSYLPLAHIYGRLVDQIALSEGAAIGFFRGDILGLVDDMKILQPTGFISVPRLFNRFNSAIRTATIEADGFKGALSRHVINTKKSSMQLAPGKASNTHFLYDKIWTPKVKAAVGLQRAHSMISGSAQLDPDVQVFLRAAFANNFMQGYGMTETYAVGTIQLHGDFSTGNIGGPMACIETCLESVPEFEYSVDDKPHPRGELLLRGPVVFREYYKNAEETAKTIDPDGWFHSGDICEVDKMGRFKIIDRKKNVLKLAQGEYISPERIENVYMGSTNLVNMAFVHGDGTQSSLVGIFGIDVENFAPFAGKILQESITPSDVAAIKAAANDPKVKAKFLKLLDTIGKGHKFNSFEKVRNVHLEVDPFTVDNELLTPTLKLKRPQAARAFREHIDRMQTIDLTGDSPPTATINSLPFPKPQELPVAHEEPPAKRRRVDSNGDTRRRSLKACLQEQVLPHVSRIVNELSPAVYEVDKIAIQTVTLLAQSARFRTRLDETLGYLLPQDEADIAAWARLEVKRLADVQQYRVHPIVERISSPAPPIKTTDISTTTRHRESPRPHVPPPTKPPPTKPPATKPPAAQLPPPPQPAVEHPNLQLRLNRPRAIRREPRPDNKWFQLSQRPYRTASDRENIAKGAGRLHHAPRDVVLKLQSTVYHVDFTAEEVAEIARLISTYEVHAVPGTLEALARMCLKYNVPTVVGSKLQGRTSEDVRNLCSDLLAGKGTSLQNLQVLSLNQDKDDQRGQRMRTSRIQSLLLAREIEGNAGFGRMRQYENFQNEFKKGREDALQVVAEFTNCAGDITTGSWVSDNNLICGTTAHSDTHNQQYNKPGNLLLCSTKKGTLRAFPDHRIRRPVVEKGENSTEAMRRSQDPWLYSSVVSSDYDKVHDLAYTSSFDKTVKVWKVDAEGNLMKVLATWHHDGNVNFVAAAKDGSGRVATAADSPTDAVRIYTIDPENPAESSYQTFSCSRSDADGSDKWAYFPATLQWGKAPKTCQKPEIPQASGTQHLLLVGYSPRSTSGEDLDIPEDKRNSGEIMLWDAEKGCRVQVVTGSTANVFEVAWHPMLHRFIAATSPTGLSIDHGVKTQIHVFQRDFQRADGAFTEIQALDCPACDINELTIMPNSVPFAYVTAACTDGRVYVWDTAQGDKPVHVLRHGYPLDDFSGDREREDTGVKFTAWGSSTDRFYTGSSDGIVRVWNVRNWRKPLVRKLLEAPGPISFGAFSPDYSKLAIGDATGRVFLLSVDERDELEAHITKLPDGRRVRRPQPLIPHPEPPAPEADPDTDDSDAEISSYSRRTYLDTHQLILTPNPVIGVIQGPQYAATKLFRPEAHLDGNPAGPLLADFERHQQENEAFSRGRRRRSVRRLRDPGVPDAWLEIKHAENRARDLDVSTLPEEDMEELVRAGALLSMEEDWGLVYEELPAGLAGEG
ncbi:hypothetical protein G7046_g6669 [Stylonectria norvegica]|nr:hypothetical protein G7046_g6669 [Stylonectria norvegica]